MGKMKLRVSLVTTVSLLCSVLNVHASEHAQRFDARTAGRQEEIWQLRLESCGIFMKQLPIVAKGLAWISVFGYLWGPQYYHKLNKQYLPLVNCQDAIQARINMLSRDCSQYDSEKKETCCGLSRRFKRCCGARAKEALR
jgi:hypothetical protein